jgi:hypothetical protein
MYDWLDWLDWLVWALIVLPIPVVGFFLNKAGEQSVKDAADDDWW